MTRDTARSMTGGYLIESLPMPGGDVGMYRLWVCNPSTLEERCVMVEATTYMPKLATWIYWHDLSADGKSVPSRVYFESGMMSLRKVGIGFAPPKAAQGAII